MGGWNNHAGYENKLSPFQSNSSVLSVSLGELLDDVLEIHVKEVVSHELCVADEVAEFELQQLGGGFSLV